MLEIIGWVGTFLFSFCAVPQCIKTFTTKSAKDISWMFLGMWFFGEIMTFAYVLVKNMRVDDYQIPLLVNYVFNFLLLCFLISCKVKYDGSKN